MCILQGSLTLIEKIYIRWHLDVGIFTIIPLFEIISLLYYIIPERKPTLRWDEDANGIWCCIAYLQYHRVFRNYVLHIFGPWVFERFPFGLQANNAIIFRSKTINGCGDCVGCLQCCFVRFGQCWDIVMLVILIHAGAQ